MTTKKTILSMPSRNRSSRVLWLRTHKAPERQEEFHLCAFVPCGTGFMYIAFCCYLDQIYKLPSSLSATIEFDSLLLHACIISTCSDASLCYVNVEGSAGEAV
jgi:hypothetical protein